MKRRNDAKGFFGSGGFTYTEVVVALSVFIIFLTPALAAIGHAAGALGADRYRAQLYASGLLSDTQDRLACIAAGGEEPDLAHALAALKLSQISGFGTFGFAELYDTDTFQYEVSVYQIAGGSGSGTLLMRITSDSFASDEGSGEISASGLSDAYLINSAVFDKKGSLLFELSKVVVMDER